eukprot:m.36624 g.36624  ORF g.36624 m.36624 type:complete len:71 (+) comp10025_c0_seq3:1248-1460(+)
MSCGAFSFLFLLLLLRAVCAGIVECKKIRSLSRYLRERIYGISVAQPPTVGSTAQQDSTAVRPFFITVQK